MDDRDVDFEFDFFPEEAAATAGGDEELLWEESEDDLQRPRRPAAGAPPHVVQRRRIFAGAAVALLLLIILVIVLTSGGGGGSGSYQSYVNEVSAVASDSQNAGTSLSDVTRKTAPSKLDALMQQTTDDVNRLQALTPPRTLAAPHAQALAALDLRLLGLQQLRDAVSKPSGGSPDPGVATLVASDRLWESSVRTPANAVLQARGLGGVFPSSTFVGDQASLVKKLDTITGSTATSPTGAVLTLGSKGADVTAWQNGLNQWLQATGSSLTPLTADGTFGTSTQQVTAALQTNQGLSPDGVVGPSTRQALQKAIQAAKAPSGSGTGGSTAAALKLGDTGQDVVTWQQQLNRWLHATSPTQTPLSTDGSFGAATQTATEQLQTAAGLTPTGQVDAQTRQALASALANAGPNRG